MRPIAPCTAPAAVGDQQRIVPRYADIDAGAMVVAAVDEAVRNAVCVGVDVDRMAGLDNFCWPDPIVSEKTPDGRFKLAQLVRANRELERMCRAYRVPCVSGKDSMKNDYGTGRTRFPSPQPCCSRFWRPSRRAHDGHLGPQARR